MTYGNGGMTERAHEAVEAVGIILGAGCSRRMNAGMNKVWFRLGGVNLLQRCIDTFRASPLISHLVVVASEAELPKFKAFLESQEYRDVSLVAGGAERQNSVSNALQFLRDWPGWAATAGDGAIAGDSARVQTHRLVAIHDAARPLLTVDLLHQSLEAAVQYRAIGLAMPVKDTIKQVDAAQMVLQTPERSGLWAMQTPQVFDFELIRSCYQQSAGSGLIFSDDCSVVEYAGYPVKLVPGSYQNLKITTPEDLQIAESLLREMEGNRGKAADARAQMRIGQGFDVHSLVPGRKLVLGGVTVPYELGLLGHSDADVLIHAVMDAMLGAIGAGDIGQHFPDTDPAYRNADSTQLLTKVLAMVREAGYRVANLDCTVVAQQPKLAGFIPEMRQKMADILEVTTAQVSVKATTTEKLGFTGRGEGIAALAVILVEPDLVEHVPEKPIS